MKMMKFAKRNGKEIVRDPLNIAFGLGFPIVLLLILTLIQSNIPVSLFELDKLTPGITVFGLSFMALFSSVIVSKDRGTSFLQRLYTTPLTAWDFILGYTLPIVPLGLLQAAICYAAAFLLGLEYSNSLWIALILIIPISLFYVGLGLLCGTLLNDKQVGGVCGALLTNVSAWLSGIWFDIELVGGTFKKIADFLPFIHAVEMERAAFSGNYNEILPHLAVVLIYAVITVTAAVLVFFSKMKK